MCVYSNVFARAKRGRTKSFIIIKYKVRFKCRIFCIFFAPRKEAKPRIELRAKKGNFYDETMAADNEKEEEIEDEEVRFS